MEHQQAGNAVTVLSAQVPDATGYGRIVRDDNDLVTQSWAQRRVRSPAHICGYHRNFRNLRFDGEVLTHPGSSPTENVKARST